MVIHTSADLGPGEHPYACFSAESRPLTSAYIARVRVDRPMDSIEAQRVKTVPGNLLMMRRAEEETANQCSNTKESTGAPVSASEQDSHTPLRPSVRHRVHREVARPAGRSVDAAPVGELSSLLTVKTIKHLKRRNLTKVF